MHMHNNILSLAKNVLFVSALSYAFSSDQAKKLAILEQENDSLKKLVADKELENFALREFIKKTIFKGNYCLSEEYECSCKDNLQQLQHLKSKAVQASQQTL